MRFSFNQMSGTRTRRYSTEGKIGHSLEESCSSLPNQIITSINLLYGSFSNIFKYVHRKYLNAVCSLLLPRMEGVRALHRVRGRKFSAFSKFISLNRKVAAQNRRPGEYVLK